jgi:hypothetical protein
MDLSPHEREDVCQDLRADLIARLKDFDPERGCLAAFATVVTQHYVAHLVRRFRRNRALFSLEIRASPTWALPTSRNTNYNSSVITPQV